MPTLLSFQRSCDLAAALGAFLTIGMVFMPAMTISVLGVTIDDTGEFVTRRMGLLFLGLFVLMIFARNSGPSEARTAIARSVVAMMATLAVLGVIEFARDVAGPGILYVAVLIEVLLTIFFLPYTKSPD